MVCTKEMCAMRVKFSRKPESLEIRHIFFVFFFAYMCPGSKAFIGFSKGYVTPPPNSKKHCRDEEGANNHYGTNRWRGVSDGSKA